MNKSRHWIVVPFFISSIIFVLFLSGSIIQPVKADEPIPLCWANNFSSASGGTALQQAIDAASANDFIYVSGTCTGSFVVHRSLVITNGCAPGVVACTVEPAVIDGGLSGRVIHVVRGMTVTIENITVRNGANAGGEGGGIYNQGSLYFWGSDLVNNSAVAGSGGGIYNDASSYLELQGATVQGNAAQNGGGIFNKGELNILNSVLANNDAKQNGGVAGGAILNDGGIIHIENTTIENNVAGTSGGAIKSQGETAKTDILFSTLSGNDGGFSGGAIWHNAGDMNIETSTLSGNLATVGGGIYSTGPLTVSFSTISHNSDGGIYNTTSAAILTLKSTIIANSTGGYGDCTNDFGLISQGSSHNLIEDTGVKACGFINNNNFNITGQDPRLFTLVDNGGPTRTHALLDGSPALEKGDTESCFFPDQRGVSRPRGADVGADCDIGAYERSGLDFPGYLFLPVISK